MSLTVALLIGYARNGYMHACTAPHDTCPSKVLPYVRYDFCHKL